MFFKVFLVLLHQHIDLQPDQLVQPHIQDRICLHLGESKLRSRFFGLLGLKSDALGHTLYETVLYLLLASAARAVPR